MVTLGKKVFALGGQRHLNDDSTLDYIEVFNNKSESWSRHLPSLLSKTTNGLAVTELPLSAVSCNKGCKCGDKSGSRIVGGKEAEVINKKKNPIWSDSLSGWFASMVGSAAYKWEERYLLQPMCSNTGGRFLTLRFQTISFLVADRRRHVPHRCSLFGELGRRGSGGL